MAKFEISIDLPKGVDFVRLQNGENGWEATCISHQTVDKFEVVVPAQFGFVFKQNSPEAAIKHAAEMARNKTLDILRKRASAPDPRLSEEDKLLKMLGL